MIAHSKIDFAKFGISDDHDNEDLSSADLTTYELFNGNLPVEGGLYDSRLGTTDHHFRCQMCLHNKKKCCGHYGVYRLDIGVQQPLMIQETRKWLRAICLECGNLMIPREALLDVPIGKRFAIASSLQQKDKGARSICNRCGAKHPKIVKDDEDHMTFRKESEGFIKKFPSDKAPKIYPHELTEIFERVSDELVTFLGINPEGAHPRKSVIHSICIPPPTIRPGVRKMGAHGNTYHDTTLFLQYLIKKNVTLNKTLKPGQIVDINLAKHIQNMQQLYYEMIYGSSTTAMSQGSSGKRGTVVGNRPTIATLRQYTGKQGLPRKNLVGKRTKEIARTTITNNSFTKITQVVIPVAFAQTVQIAEVVQDYNKERLFRHVLNGHKYPGASRIRKKDTGNLHDIDTIAKSYHQDFSIQAGDIVYRDVVTGDLVFFNRQPTLERSSIGVHEVVVTEDPNVHTFQINIGACKWYNADLKMV